MSRILHYMGEPKQNRCRRTVHSRHAVITMSKVHSMDFVKGETGFRL